MQKLSSNAFIANRWQITDKALSWQQAIELACKPLIEEKSISYDYVTKIIATVNQSRPYFILSEGFAMPHARPEDGVLTQTTRFSLLKSTHPVIFPNHEKVTLFIVLAASNNQQHLQAITELLTWLEDDDRLNKLLAVTSQNQLASLL